MNLEDLRVKVEAGEFRTKLTYRMQGDSKEENRKARDAYHQDDQAKHSQFHAYLSQCFVEAGAPEKVTIKLVNKAWADGHSGGFGCVIDHAEELMDIVNAWIGPSKLIFLESVSGPRP